jgi:hypothetical protein
VIWTLHDVKRAFQSIPHGSHNTNLFHRTIQEYTVYGHKSMRIHPIPEASSRWIKHVTMTLVHRYHYSQCLPSWVCRLHFSFHGEQSTTVSDHKRQVEEHSTIITNGISSANGRRGPAQSKVGQAAESFAWLLPFSSCAFLAKIAA